MASCDGIVDSSIGPKLIHQWHNNFMGVGSGGESSDRDDDDGNDDDDDDNDSSADVLVNNFV